MSDSPRRRRDPETRRRQIVVAAAELIVDLAYNFPKRAYKLDGPLTRNQQAA